MVEANAAPCEGLTPRWPEYTQMDMQSWVAGFRGLTRPASCRRLHTQMLGSTACAARSQELLIKAHSAAESAVEVSAIQQRLTLEERRIFDGGRASVAAFDRWRHSDLVPQHRRLLPQKRKLPQDADARNGTATR